MKLQFIILLILINIGVKQNTFAISLNNQQVDSLLQIIKSESNDTTKVNAFANLADFLGKSFPDSAKDFVQKGLEITQKINYKKGEADLYKNLGNINWSIGALNESIDAFNKALKLYTTLSKSTDRNKFIFGKMGIGYCYNGLGIVCFLQGNYSKAINYFQLSLENQESVNNEEGIAKCYNNIGLIHWKQNNLERAIEYFEKSLATYDKIKHYKEMAAGYNNVAIIYKRQKKYGKALDYYNKALQILLSENNKKGIALCYNNMGMLYEELDSFPKAIKYYNNALKLKITIDDKKGIASTYGNIASITNKIASTKKNKSEKIDSYQKAIQLAQKGLEITENRGLLYQEMELQEILSKSFEGLENFEKSLEHYKIYKEINDSLFNSEKNKQIEEAEAKFQTAQKQQEIEKQKIELEKQKNYRNSLITFSLLILLFAILLYNRYVLKKRKNEELEKINFELNKLSIVARETDNAITIFDSQGNIEWINEGFTRLLGYNIDELRKKVGNNIIKASTTNNINELIEKVFKEKRSVNYESTIISKDGRSFNLQTTLTPILKKNNEIIKIISIDSDITELKKAEEQIIQKNEEITSQKEEIENHRNHLEKLVKERTQDLEIAKEKAEESDRLKSSFLTNMSHEIRTPMNAIIGFSDMLADEYIDPETKKTLISEISTNSYSLINLIDNILELAKIDTNQIQIQKTKFTLNKTLNDIYNSHIDVIQLKGIKFNLIIPDENIIIFSDGYRITQIFKNLIDNAIKFTEKGEIEIGFSVIRNSIEFFVKDTGIGLSENQQNHIFNRFTKIEDDKKKLYRGAGLGLAICSNIVKLLNGNIWVESEPDHGAAFYFTVPYHVQQNQEVTDSKNSKMIVEDLNWAGKTLLIAEDEDSNFRYLEMLIRNTKAKLIRAENGKEAIEICDNNNIDLILMDIKMPIIDGLEATKIIKNKLPKLPIISVSAFSSKEDVELSKKAGCEKHLSKPIQRMALLSAIKKYLEK